MRTSLLALVAAALLSPAAHAGPAIRIEVREKATQNPDLVHQWAEAVRAELSRRQTEFVVVKAGGESDVVLVVKSCLIDTRADDGVRVWHVGGYFQTRDGYAGPLSHSYEEPNSAAVIKRYVEDLPGRIELARRLGQRLPDNARE